MAKVVNTFTGGLSRDTSPTKQDNTHIYYGENFRITTQDGSSSAVLENTKGNLLTINFPTHEYDYIDHCFIRNDLILFAKTSSTNYIYRIDHKHLLDSITNKIDITLNNDYYHLDSNFLVDGEVNLSNLVYTGILNLNFSTSRELVSYGRYESPTIQKIYFSDSLLGLRYINIIHNSKYNDLTNGFLDVKSIHSGIINPPVVDVISGGNSIVGKKQYAVQLYSLHGSETLFSPVSSPVFITSSELTPSYGHRIKGELEGTIVNKAVKITPSLSSGDISDFSRIRIVSIDYSTSSLVPTIRICVDTFINSDNLVYIDNGESLGTYSLEEFRGLTNFSFSAKHLSAKDNILFAANIVEDFFDIGDYDTRAYRFNSLGYSRIYENNDSYYTINSVGDWTKSTGESGTLWTIPENADCINKYNFYNFEHNPTYAYIYQIDGTIGCEGKNIKIEIISSDVNIDLVDLPADQVSCIINPLASPNTGSLGYYLANEIYRLGIVFRDTYGRRSVPKWSCDLRMPTNVGNDIVTTSGFLTRYKSYYLKVTVKTMPTGATSWELIRSPRRDIDKTILGYGALVASVNNTVETNEIQAFSDKPFSNTPGVLNIGDGAGNQVALAAHGKVFKFVSPDLLFNPQELESSYSVKIIGLYSGITTKRGYLNNLSYIDGGAHDSMATITKYTVLEGLVSATNYQVINLDFITTIYEDPFGVSNGLTISGDDRELRNNVFAIEGIPTFGGMIGQGGKAIIVSLVSNPSFSYSNFAGYDILYAALQRDSYAAIYGGYTYSGRNSSEYIGCYGESTLVNTGVNIYGGDTYPGTFSYVHSHMVPDSESPTDPGRKIYAVLNIPIESSYNLLLRTDENPISNSTNRAICMLRSSAGSYLANDGSTRFNQTQDLYSYNKSYSRELDSEKFIPQENIDIQTKFDNRIFGSNVKTNGELVDNWLKFKVENFIDADTQYGPITALFNYNDTLYFFQEKAFGYLPINEETAVATDSNAKLVLASGGILERYKYISTESGAYSRKEVLPTKYGIFYIDRLNSAICLFTGTQGTLKDLKLEKDLDSFISSNISRNFSGYIGYNDYSKDVYFSLTNLNKTLVYNVISNTFTEVHSFYSPIFIQFDKYLLSKYTTSGLTPADQLFTHSIGDKGNFYGTVYPSILQFIVNPGGNAIYETMEWFSECVTSLGVKLNKTLYSIRVKTGYQDSGEIILTPYTNISQRFRDWNTSIPRARYDLSGNTLERNDSRMRDHYLLVEVKFNNDSNERLTLSDITTNVTHGNAISY